MCFLCRNLRLRKFQCVEFVLCMSVRHFFKPQTVWHFSQIIQNKKNFTVPQTVEEISEAIQLVPREGIQDRVVDEIMEQPDVADVLDRRTAGTQMASL